MLAEGTGRHGSSASVIRSIRPGNRRENTVCPFARIGYSGSVYCRYACPRGTLDDVANYPLVGVRAVTLAGHGLITTSKPLQGPPAARSSEMIRRLPTLSVAFCSPHVSVT